MAALLYRELRNLQRKILESPLVGVSSGQRVGLHTECIDQLKKWHALLVDGAITEAQYDDFQAKILNDMQRF